MSNSKKKRDWTVRRIVWEYYSVKADSKEEALKQELTDPYYVSVQKETASLRHPFNSPENHFT